MSDLRRSPAQPDVLIPPSGEDPGTWRHGLAILATLVSGGIVLRLADATGIAQVHNFLLITTALLVEAIPFVLLGAIVGAFIHFVPGRFFERVARLPRPFQMPLAGLGGFAFPVCECGSVPVAARMIAKGLAPPAAITFMLAAPILNPITLWATWVAYRGRDIMWPMVLGRLGLGLVVAMAVGVAVSWRRGKEELLRLPTDTPADETSATACDEHCGPHGHHHSRSTTFFAQASNDFIRLAKYLVIGVAIAAAIQTFVPQGVVAAVAETPVISILALMALAAVASICSESDAFVAASFVQFGLGPQLAFLVFGPMVDSKLVLLYMGTFSRVVVRRLVVVAATGTLVGALVLDAVVG